MIDGDVRGVRFRDGARRGCFQASAQKPQLVTHGLADRQALRRGPISLRLRLAATVGLELAIARLEQAREEACKIMVRGHLPCGEEPLIAANPSIDVGPRREQPVEEEEGVMAFVALHAFAAGQRQELQPPKGRQLGDVCVAMLR